MSNQLILDRLEYLPDNLKVEVLHYIEFLRTNYTLKEGNTLNKKRGFGSAQGKYEMAADFDAPLEDFSEYMK